MEIDWSSVERKRQPTRREVSLYRQWKKYLTDSKLSPTEIDSRAKAFAEQKKKVPRE